MNFIKNYSAALLVFCAFEANAQTPIIDNVFHVELESGAVFSGANSIRISGSEGTRFDAQTLKTDPTPFLRLRAGYTFGKRHTVSVLYAPLRVGYQGNFDKNILFNGKNFAAGDPLKVNYKFNSYRITYRYNLINRDAWVFGLGLSGKVRDAYIEVESSTQSTKKSNLGVVPLVNIYLSYQPNNTRLGALFHADALASPNGRAEDAFLGLTYRIARSANLMAGYRILEGGADNDEVYNFSLFHYASAGLNLTF